jgi:hypothetical protein
MRRRAAALIYSRNAKYFTSAAASSGEKVINEY